MKRILIGLLAILIASPGLCRGQVSGNIGYAQSGGRRGRSNANGTSAC